MDATAQSGEGGAAEPKGPVRLVVVMRHAQVYRPTKPGDLCEHNVPAAFPKQADDATSTGRHEAGGAATTRDRSDNSDHPACAQCQWGSLSWTGAREARAVGDRLAETLVDTFDRCEVTIYHADTHETTGTAEIIAERIGKAGKRLDVDEQTHGNNVEGRRSLSLDLTVEANDPRTECVRSSGALGQLVRRGAGADRDDVRKMVDRVFGSISVPVPQRDWIERIGTKVEWFIRTRPPGDGPIGDDGPTGDDAPPARVVVLVANDPVASWLLHRLAGVNRDFSTPWLHHPSRLPIRRGEGVAAEHVRQGRPAKTVWRPVWAVSPGSSELIEELRAKIRSKMDSAKQLGAFVTALVTFAVTRVLAEIHREQDPLEGGFQASAWIGVGILAVGAVGFFVTLYRYDSLLMPTEAWAAVRLRRARPRSGVFARPPSSASWVLFQNMMLIWRRSFTVAILAAGVGATVVAVSLAEPSSGAAWLLIVSILVPAVVAGVLVWWGSRPVLGATD